MADNYLLNYSGATIAELLDLVDKALSSSNNKLDINESADIKMNLGISAIELKLATLEAELEELKSNLNPGSSADPEYPTSGATKEEKVNFIKANKPAVYVLAEDATKLTPLEGYALKELTVEHAAEAPEGEHDGTYFFTVDDGTVGYQIRTLTADVRVNLIIAIPAFITSFVTQYWDTVQNSWEIASFSCTETTDIAVPDGYTAYEYKWNGQSAKALPVLRLVIN